MFYINKILFFCFSIVFFSGCTLDNNIPAPHNKPIEKKTDFTNKLAQSKIRDIQTRVFKGIKKDIVEKAVVNTMVDEDFFITLIDNKKGIITATGNKNTLDLRFIAVIKQTENENISVRFNVDTIRGEPFNKRYEIVKNDLLYEYLFSRLKKSISLEQEYKNSIIVSIKSE